MFSRDPLPTLLLGLAVGVLGSYSDDILGAGTAVDVLQVALWVLSAAIVIAAFIPTRGQDRLSRGGLHPSL